MNEPKRCPFCGSDDIQYKCSRPLDNNGTRLFWCQCALCESRSRAFSFTPNSNAEDRFEPMWENPAMNHAILAWNSRIHEQEVSDEVEVLKYLIRQLLPYARERLATMNAANSPLILQARLALRENIDNDKG